MTGVRVGYVLEPPYPTFFTSEIDAVRRAGAEVSVFNSFRPFAQLHPAAETLRRESHYFPDAYEGVLAAVLRSLWRRPRAAVRVANFLRRHHLGARLGLLAAHYARIVEDQGIQHLHGGYGTTPATIAMLTSWLTDTTYSFTLHAAYDMFLSNPLLPLKARGAAFVTTVSRFNRESLLRRYPSLRETRLEVVRLGVSLEAWPVRSGEPGNEQPVCISVANLGPTKGHAVLLRALARLRDRGVPLRVVLVGDGELRCPLQALAEQLGVRENVAFLGHLPPPAVHVQLRQADVFALPVVVAGDGNHDGLPVALMEAMACGVPVISSDVAGISELVRQNETGLLTQPGDDGALAEALLRVLKDAPGRRRLVVAARKLVEAEYDQAANANRMVALFTRPA